MDGLEEILDVVDRKGKPTGETVSRSKAHEEGILHSTAYAFLYNDNKILFQQRGHGHQFYPNMWDASIAGHIEAGDQAIETLVREAQEELGIYIPKSNFLHWKNFHDLYEREVTIREEKDGEVIEKHRTYINNEVMKVHLSPWSGTRADMKLQKSEVSLVHWIKTDKLREVISEQDSEYLSRPLAPRQNNFWDQLCDVVDELSTYKIAKTKTNH